MNTSTCFQFAARIAVLLPASTSARAARKRLTLPFDVLQALIESQHSDRAMAIFAETQAHLS